MNSREPRSINSMIIPIHNIQRSREERGLWDVTLLSSVDIDSGILIKKIPNQLGTTHIEGLLTLIGYATFEEDMFILIKRCASTYLDVNDVRSPIDSQY